MLKDIVAVRPLDDHRLHLRFEDGVEGIVDISKEIRFTGVFAPLREKPFFDRVSVNTDFGTIVWPNGADLDPDVLYAKVTGRAILGAKRMRRTKDK